MLCTILFIITRCSGDRSIRTFLYRLNMSKENTLLNIDDDQTLLNESQNKSPEVTQMDESWEIYRRFFQTSPDPVFITTQDGRWIDMNEAALLLFGYSEKEEIWNDSVLEFYWDPRDRKKYVQTLMKNGYVKEYPIKLRKKDGTSFEALISATPFDVGGKTIGFQGFVKDLSQEIQAEKEKNQLLEQQAYLSQESEALVKKLISLQRIEQTVLENLSLPTTLDVLIELLVKELGVDAADILYLHPSLKTLKFITQTGFKQNILQHTDLEIGEGLAGEAAESKKLIYIQDLTNEEINTTRSLEFATEKFITYFGVPLLTKGRLVGVLEIFNRSTIDPEKEWLSLLEMTAGLAAIAIDIQNLRNDLERSKNEINKAFDDLIEGWALALELRGIEDEGHSSRAEKLAVELALKLGLKEDEIVNIRRGALLHDIGKMGIPDQVLLKGSSLTKAERKLITKHPVDAYNLLKSIEI